MTGSDNPDKECRWPNDKSESAHVVSYNLFRIRWACCETVLTPTQFRDKWHAEVELAHELADDVRLVTIPAERLSSFGLSQAAREYLSEAGLPKSCAPGLSFDLPIAGPLRLWEVFSPTEWQPGDKVGLEHYLMMGSDGAGNPLCIDERDGTVVVLDHERLFDVKRRDKRTVFINSEIPQFLESLLVFQQLSPEAFWSALRQIDPAAAQEGTFCSSECRGTTDKPQSALTKILYTPLGTSDSAGIRWLWVSIAIVIGAGLALILSRLLRP